MSRLYEVGVIDNVTAGWGTVWVQEKGKLPTYLIPENPVEVINAVNGGQIARATEEVQDGTE